MAEMFQNPIIPGFYPDPSMIRVGDDYYIANSSFGLFPGVPIFHSRDLVNWEQIGNALDRIDQHYVAGDSVSGGIMAPTIRYHDGMFYLIVANFAAGGNLMVTATDPAGPWSDPYDLPDIPGIDASIFFDDDGKCYAQGTGCFDENGNLLPGMRLAGNRGIWMCEFDVKTMKAVTPKKYVWNSAMINAWCPEAPHVYKKDGWYYLLIAEGGTEHNHAVTIARCREVMGLYEACPANPILTHRHLGYNYPIANIGHADLVELPDGSWYGVALGSRFLDGYHKNLGRETVLFPVEWQDGWPICCPMTGKVELSYPVPACLQAAPVRREPAFDDFDSDHLAMYWCTVGTPDPAFYTLANSCLNLTPGKRTAAAVPPRSGFAASGDKAPKAPMLSYVCRRQRSFNFDFTAAMKFAPGQEGESAGLYLDHAENGYILELGLFEGVRALRVTQVLLHTTGSPMQHNLKSEVELAVLALLPWEGDTAVLRISERNEKLCFYAGESAEALTLLSDKGDARLLNPPVNGGMVGAMIGLYATAAGQESTNTASFDWAEYLDC